MSDLQRFVRQLADTLRSRHPDGAHRPVAVGDLRRSILPYRLYRNALGLVSNDDYDLLVLRLCAEDGGWARTLPPEVAARCREELAAPYPDLGLLDTIDDATVQIGAAALALASAGPGPAPEAAVPDLARPVPPPAPTEPAHAALRPATAPPDAPPPAALRSPATPPDMPPPVVPQRSAGRSPAVPAPPARSAAQVPAAERCRFCAAIVPPGRPVIFCPFCGRQLQVASCTRCGAELEPGWRHCITCGQPVPGTVNV